MSDSTTLLDLISTSQGSKEVSANELFDAGSVAMSYGRRAQTTTGLTWGYYGTRYGGTAVANGTNVCGASTTTYMVAHLTTGAVTFATTTTNWDNTTTYGRCYKIVTGASAITSYEDHRFGPGGVFGAGSGSGGSVELRGLTFVSDTGSTADSDPGNGLFKWNNATQASATFLYFDNQTEDAISLTTFYASLGASGFIYLQQSDDATKWQLWKWTAVTAGSGYYKFAVTLQASAGSITDNKTTLCDFSGLGGVAASDTVTALSIASGVVDINCALGDYFTLTLTANVTSITFSNLPGSGKGASKWVEIVQGSGPYTVTWPASFKWAAGAAGVVSTVNATVDELAITTVNNGTAWKATLAKAFA